MPYFPITSHGLIGDLHTAALVANDGKIVWLPWPRFDSPSLFAALLDEQQGGEWLLAPRETSASEQTYDGETAILATHFTTPSGQATLYDWMSPWEGVAPGHDLCRLLRCTAGEVTIIGRFAPRPDYARQTPRLESAHDGLHFHAQGLHCHLVSNYAWHSSGTVAQLEITLRQGEELHCIFHSGARLPIESISADLERTRQFWQRWIGSCSYNGRWASYVRRSAITLKLLTYAPNGAIIAAPTTSLPEWIGSVRNWDYRYTWLRDASFTLAALYLLGYHAEAQAFFTWIHELSQRYGAPLQIMYGVGGEAILTEYILAHLEGYRASRPVRIGNAAYKQHQLDVYGGLIDAAYLYEQRYRVLDQQEWEALAREIDHVCAHWQEPDHSIWEIRGPARQHTFSKVMCWLTLDRGIRLAKGTHWGYDEVRWVATRDAIHADILRYGWNEVVGAFTQSYGSADLDASLLIMPLIGFLPPHDPRIQSTVRRIAEQLSVGALVYRYRNSDHLPSNEGAFLLCSFWLVDALVAVGRLDEAVQHFEELLHYASPHGLLAEEVDPATGTALGNYPQAFSHIGLINSALSLSCALDRRAGAQPSDSAYPALEVEQGKKTQRKPNSE